MGKRQIDVERFWDSHRRNSAAHYEEVNLQKDAARVRKLLNTSGDRNPDNKPDARDGP